MKLLTREQARKIDQTAIHELGIPGVVLMENAGARTVELFLRLVGQTNHNIQPFILSPEVRGPVTCVPCCARCRCAQQDTPAPSLRKISENKRLNIIICCGKGNNGSDGYVIARYLFNLGLSVQILLFAKPEKRLYTVGSARIYWTSICNRYWHSAFS